MRFATRMALIGVSLVFLTLIDLPFSVSPVIAGLVFILLFRVTLPGVRWALLYGIILCNARAMGEFGAVAVVSGHIRGQTTTMPLQVEILYNEYDLVGAFAVASLLMLLSVLTLLLKAGFESVGSRRRVPYGAA